MGDGLALGGRSDFGVPLVVFPAGGGGFPRSRFLAGYRSFSERGSESGIGWEEWLESEGGESRSFRYFSVFIAMAGWRSGDLCFGSGVETGSSGLEPADPIVEGVITGVVGHAGSGSGLIATGGE